MAGRSSTTIHRAISGSLFALSAGWMAVACQPTHKIRVALIGATVIDGTGGAVLPDAVVVVKGTRIETIAQREGFKIPKATLKVDVTGRYIIPGLIDAHAHVERWALPRYVAYGVTTVRDVGNQQDTILALREEAGLAGIVAPRIFTAGAMLDGEPPTYSTAVGIKTEDGARRAVDAHAVAGVDLIKTYTRVTPSLLRAIVDEASTFGFPVASHLGLTDAVTAGQLGVTTIEHLTGIPEAASSEKDRAKFYAAHQQSFFAGWNYFERSWAKLDSAQLSRVASELAGDGVIMVPTLVLHETLSRLDDPALLLDPGLKAVPDTELARWNLPDLKARAGWTEADYAAFRASRPNQDLFLREFVAAGGTVVAGSDASNQMLVPGLSEHSELYLLVEAGLTPAEALKAATRSAATLLKADSLGVIAAGKSADLVVLKADPLQDIKNTLSVEWVMVRGALMSADSIRAGW